MDLASIAFESICAYSQKTSPKNILHFHSLIYKILVRQGLVPKPVEVTTENSLVLRIAKILVFGNIVNDLPWVIPAAKRPSLTPCTGKRSKNRSKETLHVEYDLLQMQVQEKEQEIALKSTELEVILRYVDEIGDLLSAQEGGEDQGVAKEKEEEEEDKEEAVNFEFKLCDD